MISKSIARRARALLGRPAHGDPVVSIEAPPPGPQAAIWSRFVELAHADRPSPVLEIGTLQSIPGRPTHHQSVFPWVARPEYVMADIQAGPDVDVLADLHALPAEWGGRYGAFVASAVFEHLERPWIAAQEVARILKPGGLFVIATHQTFPLHGFPHDFFRFSKEALALIMADAGLEVIDCAYEGRCKILPPKTLVHPIQIDQWNEAYPSYILVSAVGRKPK